MPTATSTPWSTSTTRTAAVVATAITNSLRRNRASRRNSGTSTSRTAAYTTTAPSAAVGNAASTRPANDTASTVASAVNTPLIRLRPPTASLDRGPAAAAADREPLHQTGTHVGSAERQQLALGVDPSRRRSAKARPVAHCRCSRRRRRRRRGQQGDDPVQETPGSDGTGRALGTSPMTVTPSAARSSRATAAAAPSIPISAIGRGNRQLPTITTNVVSPSTSVGPCTASRLRSSSITCGPSRSASDGTPASRTARRS